jgi:hypothetical protein
MLNQLCEPTDVVARDEHKHRCPCCKTCWKHKDSASQGTCEEFDEAHTCPTCGKEVTCKVMDDAQIEKALDALFGR